MKRDVYNIHEINVFHQLPNGTAQAAQVSNEKKVRIQDNLNAIQRHFKPLRAIYTRVNDDCAGMEYTHIEASDEADIQE